MALEDILRGRIQQRMQDPDAELREILHQIELWQKNLAISEDNFAKAPALLQPMFAAVTKACRDRRETLEVQYRTLQDPLGDISALSFRDVDQKLWQLHNDLLISLANIGAAAVEDADAAGQMYEEDSELPLLAKLTRFNAILTQFGSAREINTARFTAVRTARSIRILLGRRYELRGEYLDEMGQATADTVSAELRKRRRRLDDFRRRVERLVVGTYADVFAEEGRFNDDLIVDLDGLLNSKTTVVPPPEKSPVQALVEKYDEAETAITELKRKRDAKLARATSDEERKQIKRIFQRAIDEAYDSL